MNQWWRTRGGEKSDKIKRVSSVRVPAVLGLEPGTKCALIRKAPRGKGEEARRCAQSSEGEGEDSGIKE